MSIIDFKEIPEAGKGPDRDDWEMFAQEFLRALGFEILIPPARGPDGGRDILAVEYVEGRLGLRKIRWLVSCKHKAHSGRAVLVADENNFGDRLARFHADGFLGFYSTMATQGVVDFLENLFTDERRTFQILGPKTIESHLTSEPAMRLQLFRRFFPKSYERWMQAGDAPASLWEEYAPVLCEACGTDLLEEAEPDPSPPDPSWHPRYETNRRGEIVLPSQGRSGVFAACYGECADKMAKRTGNGADHRFCLTELCEVHEYLRAWCKMLLSRNRLENHDARKFARYMLSVAQFVMRDPRPLMPGWGPRARSIKQLLSQTFGDGVDVDGDDGDDDY